MSVRLILGILLAWASTSCAMAGGEASLRAASAISSASGKPLFAVYGTPTCPYCVELMQRLTTDQSLAKFANQFVPIKVEQDDPDWPRFNAQYATDRNAVPRIYIIASDGTAIVKQVGAPQGDGLPAMLSSALQKSGPMLPPARVRAVEEAVKAIVDKDPSTDWTLVAAQLFPIEGDVAVGNPFWEPITKATESLQSVDAAIKQSLDSAHAELAKDANDFASLVAWAKIGQLQSMSVPRKREGTSQLTELKRWKTDRQRIDLAISLAGAEIMSMQSDPRARKRAVDKLTDIAKSSNVEAAMEMAKSLLSKIDPSIEITSTPAANKEFRSWTASSGNFSKTAALRRSNATHAQLEDSDGKLMTVRIDQLSEADQAYIRQHPTP